MTPHKHTHKKILVNISYNYDMVHFISFMLFVNFTIFSIKNVINLLKVMHCITQLNKHAMYTTHTTFKGKKVKLCQRCQLKNCWVTRDISSRSRGRSGLLKWGGGGGGVGHNKLLEGSVGQLFPQKFLKI